MKNMIGTSFILISTLLFAQEEYDDIYFNKKDRSKQELIKQDKSANLPISSLEQTASSSFQDKKNYYQTSNRESYISAATDLNSNERYVSASKSDYKSNSKQIGYYIDEDRRQYELAQPLETSNTLANPHYSNVELADDRNVVVNNYYGNDFGYPSGFSRWNNRWNVYAGWGWNNWSSWYYWNPNPWYDPFWGPNHYFGWNVFNYNTPFGCPYGSGIGFGVGYYPLGFRNYNVHNPVVSVDVRRTPARRTPRSSRGGNVSSSRISNVAVPTTNRSTLSETTGSKRDFNNIQKVYSQRARENTRTSSQQTITNERVRSSSISSNRDGNTNISRSSSPQISTSNGRFRSSSSQKSQSSNRNRSYTRPSQNRSSSTANFSSRPATRPSPSRSANTRNSSRKHN